MGLNQLSLSHQINIPCDTELNHSGWKTVGLNQLSLSCQINIPCDTEFNHSGWKTVLGIKSTISVMPHQHTRQSRITPGGRLSVGCNTCCFGTPARKKMHIYVCFCNTWYLHVKYNPNTCAPVNNKKLLPLSESHN